MGLIPWPSTGKKGGSRDISIIISSTTSTATVSILVFKSTSLNAIPRKFIPSPSVLIFLQRRHDILRERKGSWSRLRLSPHGTLEEEIPMEKNELYHWPPEKKALCNLCRCICNESALDWGKLKCRIPYACSNSILWGKEFEWQQRVHSLSRSFSGSQAGYSRLGLSQLFCWGTRWLLQVIRVSAQLHDCSEAVIIFPYKSSFCWKIYLIIYLRLVWISIILL